MSSHGQEPSSPTPGPRSSSSLGNDNDLSFRPPRPGSRLSRGRKSTTDMAGTASISSPPTAPPLPKAKSGLLSSLGRKSQQLDVPASNNEGSSADSNATRTAATTSFSRSSSPSGSIGSTKSAKLYASRRACRKTLEALSERNKASQVAVGMIGMKFMQQGERVSALMSELEKEQRKFDAAGAASSDDDDGDGGGEAAERLRRLAEQAEAELRELQNIEAEMAERVKDEAGSTSGLPASSTVTTLSHLSSMSTPAKSYVAEAIRVTNSGGMPARTDSNSTLGVPTPRQERRNRNAAAPEAALDKNLVTELQNGLVLEIRRLQDEIKRRDVQIKDLESNLLDANERVTQSTHTMKRYADSEDTLKQENYDLALAKQQLDEDLQRSVESQRKFELERDRTAKELAKVKDMTEAQRVQIEAQAAELDNLKALREKESAKARKDKAGLTREMSDLQAQLNLAKSEALREKNALSRSVSHSQFSADNSHSLGDVDEEGGLAPEELAARRRAANEAPTSPGQQLDDDGSGFSPLGNRLVRDREAQDLRAKLGFAARRAQKDSNDKRKLRDQLAEMKKAMAKAGLDVPQHSDVESSGDEEDLWADDATDSPSAARRLVKGRLPKSSTRPNIANRLGLGSRSTKSISSQYSQGAPGDDSVAVSTPDRSGAYDESGDSSARRASLEGIDPAFADPTRADFASSVPRSRNKARRSTIKPGTILNNGSPLTRHSMLPGDDSHDDASSVDTHEVPFNRNARRSGPRPSSAVIEPEALGSELAELDGLGDSSMVRTTSAHELLAELDGAAPTKAHEDQVVETEPEPEIQLEERFAQTEPLPDVLGPAMAERDRQHAELVASHATILAALHESHANALAERDETHSRALAEQITAHSRAVDEWKGKHSVQLDERDQAHEAALQQKRKEHDEALTAALARQAKLHEAAVQEQRSRHTKALEQQVVERSAALSALELAHQKLLEEREAAHRNALSLKANEQERSLAAAQKEHKSALERALADKDEQHAGELEDVQATHVGYVRQVEASFNKAIRERDSLIESGRVEIERLRSRLSALENEVEQLRRQDAAAKEAAEQTEAQAAELRAEIEALRVAQAEAAAAAEAAEKDEFEDASEGHDAGAAAALAAATALTAPEMDRTVTASSAPETDGPKTPEEAVVEPPKKVEVKESGCQTDDDLWARFQQDHLLGPGGIIVLGGDKAAAAQHPRASIATFGDGREVPSSPKPAMYAVSAITGQPGRGDAALDAGTDQIQPPIMEVPPPPTLPPPPHLPAKATRRSLLAASNQSIQGPPRPLSPPPAELVTRASRSAASSTLQIPSGSASEGQQQQHPPRSSSRASGAYMPPPTSYVPPGSGGGASRQRPSVGSLRARASGGGDAGASSEVGSISSRQRKPSLTSRVSASGQQQPTRPASAMSFASDVTSEMSRRISLASSRASVMGDETAQPGSQQQRRGANGMDSTNPDVIHAITQTMIGEYLHKYTRRTMGRGTLSDKRHRRYFWLHPYTKTLYWTISDPGGASVKEGTSKSVAIEDVRVVEDHNPNPPGLYHLSIVVCTAAREIKITAPNKERHETWLNALGYLVNRPETVTTSHALNMGGIGGGTRSSPRRTRQGASQGQPSSARARLSPARSLSNFASGVTNGAVAKGSNVARANKSSDSLGLDATPRPRGGSIGAASLMNQSIAKRRNTAARQYLEQWEMVRDQPAAPPASGTPSGSGRAGSIHRTSLAHQMFGDRSEDERDVDPRLKTAEQMLEEDEKDGYEGLDNVRACCDGKHDVGALAHKHHHHHHGGGSSMRRRSGSTRSSMRLTKVPSSVHSAERPISPPPQLGPLNLNTIDTVSGGRRGGNGSSSGAHQHQPKASDASSNDWFSAGEGGNSNGNGGPGSANSNGRGASGSGLATPQTPSYTERVSAIKRARQSFGPSSAR